MRDLQTIVIGGGFYGLSIALFLRDELHVANIVVIEKEPSLMSRASYVNQARVHNGYHYPRSILTGSRSAVNFPRFVSDYQPAIVNNFDKYYAISSLLSKVNASQFKSFCEKIGLPVIDADKNIAGLFSKQLVEKVYKVTEYAFDSTLLLGLLKAKIDEKSGITIVNNTLVTKITEVSDAALTVTTTNGNYTATQVFNCSYSQINTLHRNSGLPLLAFKHEIAEMCLIKLPEDMANFSVTMMDGPFFSIMPFPAKGLHTLSHVRYTPHTSWLDDDTTIPEKQDAHNYFDSIDLQSNYKKMYADVVRYIPTLKSMEYVESITEVKTVLRKSEADDSRPILFRSDFGIANYTCIMGGKLDNVYDVFDELRELYEKV